jgi:hypothetical protein
MRVIGLESGLPGIRLGDKRGEEARMFPKKMSFFARLHEFEIDFGSYKWYEFL